MEGKKEKIIFFPSKNIQYYPWNRVWVNQLQ